MERATAETVNPVLVQSEYMLRQLSGKKITYSLWEAIIRWLFGIVGPAAAQVASLARQYYDEERARVMPWAPRHDVMLSLLEYERFAKDMLVLLPQFLGTELDEQKIGQINLRVARSIENSGRWTVMHAIEEPDPYLEEEEPGFKIRFREASEEFTSNTVPRQGFDEVRRSSTKTKSGIKGWARVPTGKETCAWCIMLCSRGAAYSTGRTAGLKIPVRDMLRYEREGSFDPKEHMHQWHDGCDCKIVPVFDLDNWDGKERADAAYEMWGELTRGFSGKDAINAFRRGIEAGADFRDYIK